MRKAHANGIGPRAGLSRKRNREACRICHSSGGL